MASDITYSPQVSSDLVSWNSGPGYIVQLSATPNGDGVTETVVVFDFTPSTAGAPQFMRLMVTGQ